MWKPDDIVFVNQVAQRHRTFGEAIEWFRRHGEPDQRQLLKHVGLLALQAGVRGDDTTDASRLTGISAGAPQCVLMTKGVPKMQVVKILRLPSGENERSFAFLLGLLAVADERRRRTVCRDQCSHWWHRDLGDAAVVEASLSSGGAGMPVTADS